MARIDALKRKLAAREGNAEFTENCEALRAEIARLESNGDLAEFVKSNGPERADDRTE
jgi:hypothetical protein